MSGIFKKMFGKSSSEKRLRDFTPVSFNSGGLSGRFDKRANTFSLTRSGGVSDALAGITGGLRDRAAAFHGLADRVGPGVGELTQARVGAIRRAGERTVGSLKDRFRQRRVLGSSFAEREIAGVESMFGKEEERAAAEGKLTELGLTAEFLSEAFASGIQSFEALLNQFNLESSLAANVSNAGTNAMLNAAQGAAALGNARRDRNTSIIGALIGFGMSGGKPEDTADGASTTGIIG